MSEQFAIIVGSGFESFVASGEVRHINTRFGEPSGPVRPVDFEGSNVLVLPRHGDDHSLPPHVINYRANLAALRELGADTVIALNTVGVVSDVREPGQVAIPDQIIDYTWGRAHTIYDEPGSGFEHIEFTQPLSPTLRTALLAAAGAAGVEQANHTRTGDAGDHGQAFPFQMLGHIGAGLLFCVCHFRYAV